MFAVNLAVLTYFSIAVFVDVTETSNASIR
jgi:hypothetical protein